MKRSILSVLMLLILASIFIYTGCNTMDTTSNAASVNLPPLKEKSIYEFSMKSIDGKEVKMDEYKGKVLLIVNVASHCGYTPQYTALQSTYAKYKDQGFFVLGFPSNDFGGQEPGTDEEVKTFCSTKYSVTFPMFSKITVVGANKHPFYRFLTEKATNPEFAKEVSWNFNKFLVDKNGKIVGSYESGITPDSAELTTAIEKALK